MRIASTTYGHDILWDPYISSIFYKDHLIISITSASPDLSYEAYSTQKIVPSPPTWFRLDVQAIVPRPPLWAN